MYESAAESVEGSPFYLMQQSRDPYAKLAKIQNYRCRSAFKLIEIQSEFKLICPGMTVLDIGASPGGWSQVIVEELKLESPPNVAASEHGRNENERFSRNDLLDEIYSMPLINFNEKENKNESGGSCVSCDLRPFRHVNGARQVIGDIFEKETLDQIQNEQREFDLVVSDAHPGASQDPKQTIYSSTQLSQRIIEDVLPQLLSPGGAFLTKALSQKLVSLMKQHFQHVSQFKPNASRAESEEFFIIGLNYKRN